MMYHIHEGALPLPSFAQDKTLNVFSVQLGPTHPAQVVISRDQLEAGETLAQSADRQFKALERQVKRLVVHLRRELVVSDQAWPALAIHSEFTQGQHTQWQAQVMAHVGDGVAGVGPGSLLVFTLSSGQKLSDEAVARWWQMVQAFAPRTTST